MTKGRTSISTVWLSALALVFSLVTAGIAHASDEEDVWPELRTHLFGDNAKISEEDGTVTMDAPYRAEDAAVVPITITIPANVSPKVKKLTLLIEKNPAPVVGKFTFGSAAGYGERKISTRVRLDMYSNVRAIIELEDGSLHMTTKYVKGAGGCSAPALKDMESALKNIGKMKLKSALLPANISTPMQEALVMVRHPNYSGMQMNQATGLYIAAKYVKSMEVKKGDEVVFNLESGISLSENPNLRFTYASGVEGPLKVKATDTDGREFNIAAKPADS